MLDVSRQTVSRWESGKSVPSSVQLSNLCKAFNIDANNLFAPNAELTELTQAVEKATDKPIPKKKKDVEKEITALRAVPPANA